MNVSVLLMVFPLAFSLTAFMMWISTLRLSISEGLFLIWQQQCGPSTPLSLIWKRENRRTRRTVGHSCLSDRRVLTAAPLTVFVKLYRVLLCAVIVIAAFFGSCFLSLGLKSLTETVYSVISSISFSSRLDEDYAPDTWKTRWCKSL